MIVLKFGGTSVGNARMMEKTLDIVAETLDRAPLLITSAMTKVTDALLHLADLASRQGREEALAAIKELHELHRLTALELLGDGSRDCLLKIEAMFAELTSIVRGLCLIREVSPRSRDAVVSFGERLSTTILYYRALQRGISVDFVDARDVIKTDDHFGSANPLKKETWKASAALLKVRKSHLVISQGFIGSTLSGVTTTLGRGGSDWSATIFGAALGAEEVQIWTDVDGIMTTDPRIVPSAKVLDSISYEEAAELSYFGAKVIHPSTIQPAVERGIPVWVKNTKNPAAIGTVIRPDVTDRGLKAIAGKKNITVITVKSSHMLNAYGFLRSIFQVFEDHKVSVDLVATSEVTVSVTVDDTTHLKAIKHELERFAEVQIEEHQSIVSLVGRDLWKNASFMARAFGALEGISVRLVSMGSSDINLSLVVSREQLEETIKKLHDALF